MKTAIVINSATLGVGPEELGEKMMGSFLRKLWAEASKPDTIIFYNSGVKLVAEGSPMLDALTELGAAGVDLIVCGTCVGYYKLNGTVRVGRVSEMREIVSILLQAEKVIGI
jgi:selenium metabolism protein YedF